MKHILIVLPALFLALQGKAAKPDTAIIQVNASQERGPVKPIWSWFGYDEPNYTYMKDGVKLLTELSALSSVPVYVRAHSLLVTGDGKAALKWGSTNAYTEDAQGNPIYNWRIIDSIFDTYIKRGMKPLAQIGFMPEALSSKPQPYRHYWKPGYPYQNIFTGWAYPPKDYNKWGELVYQWVKHSVERYGKKEVESWYWELWNEPDYGYWKGTREEFFKLYDYSAAAVKRALPTARIGGADVTGGGTKFLDAFIKHCLTDTNYVTGKTGAPLDAILFHAKGSPRLVNGRVVMGMRNQLRNIADNFKLISSYPQLKNIPIIIGESDPEGCAACGMATDPQNAYRNGTMYSSYTAASFARKFELAARYGVNLTGAVTWAFEFEDQPWFYGFRDLATNGIDKPVLNVFRMFGRMKGNFVNTVSNRQYTLNQILDSSVRGSQTDIGTLAARDKKTLAVMVWNYHDKDSIGQPDPVCLNINGIPSGKVRLTHYRIDNNHSNSYEIWKAMGSPQQVSNEQYRKLEAAGQLQQLHEPEPLQASQGKLTVYTDLPGQAVSLLLFSW
ncbi:GH39 family glycosyl hydrolase [Chitinophaga tropicalis]|uniref:Beta-xylosidase n=1 Tax=Chitinophaga tropicalis TaxID=2683588 RepID=A0A7K1U1U0_9BACT|nr:beta-xylosidase [Chitinophaga tropicalis]MVT07995.1 beta-xylosidase [Chitinophaga tropicalis]